MRRYTTPIIGLTVEGRDLTGCAIYVTIYQMRHGEKPKKLTLRPEEVAFDGKNTTMNVVFTQKSTAGFKTGSAWMQVNWVSWDGRRNATEEVELRITPNLLCKEVGFDG